MICVGLDADVIEGLLTAEDGLVDDTLGSRLGPSHSELPGEYFVGVGGIDKTTVRVGKVVS